jgi:hypothetical protein
MRMNSTAVRRLLRRACITGKREMNDPHARARNLERASTMPVTREQDDEQVAEKPAT